MAHFQYAMGFCLHVFSATLLVKAVEEPSSEPNRVTSVLPLITIIDVISMLLEKILTVFVFVFNYASSTA
jgi:hypothetical protein